MFLPTRYSLNQQPIEPPFCLSIYSEKIAPEVVRQMADLAASVVGKSGQTKPLRWRPFPCYSASMDYYDGQRCNGCWRHPKEEKLEVPDEFPDDLFLMIGSGDLELGKARVDSLISGVHLPDCPDCHGSPEALPPPRKLSREFIWEKYLMWKELA